jgi:hypothetical protein
VDRGLDRSLTLHRDGSFVLQMAGAADADADADADPASSRIWTSYDEIEKKHWLTVHKGDLHQRFLLQDNMLGAWHANRKSLPERIHVSVDEMIRAIDRMEEKGTGC